MEQCVHRLPCITSIASEEIIGATFNEYLEKLRIFEDTEVFVVENSMKVGDGFSDHYCWQRPEDMTTSRQAYSISEAV